MRFFLDIAWPLVSVLKYLGLAAALGGVAVFGWFFVRGNAQAAQNGNGTVPSSSWRGDGPMFGVRVLTAGILMEVVSVLLASVLPGRL
jgi:hypothetical protein